MYKELHKKYIIFFLITTLAFILRFYLLNDHNAWHDEWHTLYVSDPSINFNETIQRYLGDKGDTTLTEFYPVLYLFILKFFFHLFGYYDDIGRVFSLIFGTLIIPLSMYICVKYFKKENYWFVGFLITINPFLIWQSLEIRAHSLLVFASLINLIFFFEILKKKKLIIIFLYFLSSVFLLSLWPISGPIFIGKSIYLFQQYIKNKKTFFHIYLLFILIPITYILLNLDYLILNIGRDYHYAAISKSFFYNYHFRTFFGSIYTGGIFLILFATLIIINLRSILLNTNFDNILFYIIFFTYGLTLIYSTVRGADIMSPKYVIFLVPIMLIIISNLIDNYRYKNICMAFLILVSLVNIYNNYYNWPIKRPNIKYILSDLQSYKIKTIVSNENDVFNNFLANTYNYHKYNFRLFKKDEFKHNVNSFWFICQNYPRYAYGNLKRNEIDPNCLISFSDYKKTKTIKTKDMYILQFEQIRK